MSVEVLIFRYTAFAILATIANLGTQRLVLSVNASAWGFGAAVFCGTLVGLVIKYFLDKRWIFADVSRSIRAHGRKFTLYTAMGVVTTLIFWTTETAFWAIWKTNLMREIGAVIGLTFGYVIKYHLDRRFVFTDTKRANPA
ncbi:polysaccharide biosynthesis protein GtrA [Ruegeria sp. ANG-R]|uniref:GtrA family protein n=1 Tax=Ruegeria sp. ANG-R TaxID=1577903 RepID=UPI00057FFA1F|nr:GtrA family protein [Ruegeria sp. ANG-R]KIC41612.1 polysaccharide biosynthesis protein GtrA [Ruegeria sp. ANG-R]